MAIKLADAFVFLGVDERGLDRGLASAQRKTNQFTGALGVAAGNILANLATAGARAVGTLAGAFVDAVGGAADLEQQVADIAAVMNKTIDEVQPLKDLIFDLAIDPNLRVTAEQAADAVELLARNGLEMTEIMGGAAKATVLLANATKADFGTAADIATDAMAIFNIEAADMLDAVNGITSVTTNSKFSINDYRLAIAQAGGVASAVGVEFDDFNTVIASNAARFASGSDAGTSFKTFLQRLIPQSSEAAAQMQKLGLFAGLTEKEFDKLSAKIEKKRKQIAKLDPESKNYQKRLAELNGELSAMESELVAGNNAFFDAQGNLKDMNEIAIILNGALAGLSEEQRNNALSTIFGTDAMRAAVGMMEQGAIAYQTVEEAARATGLSIDDLNEFAADGITQFELLQAQMRQTDAVQSAITRMTTLSGVIDILKSVLQGVSLQIGDAFLPAAKEIGKVLIDLASTQGPRLVAFFDNLGSIITGVVGVFTALIQEGELLSAAEFGLSEQTAALVDRIVAFGLSVYDAVAAVGAFITPIIDTIAQFVSWQDVLAAVGLLITATVVPALASIAATAAPIVATFAGLVAASAGLRTAWEADFLGIRSAIQDALGDSDATLSDFAKSGVDRIRDLAQGFLSHLTFLDRFSGWFDENLPRVQALVGRVAAAINAIWQSEGGALTQIISNTYDTAMTIIDTVMNNLLDVVTLVLQLLNGEWAEAGQTLQGIASRTWDAIRTIFSNQLDSLRTVVFDILPRIEAAFDGMIQGVLGYFADTDWENVGHTAMSLLLAGISSIARAVSDTAANLTDRIKSAFGNVRWSSLGKDVIDGIIKGIKNGAFGVYDAVTDVARGAYNAFRDWWDAQSPSRVAASDLGAPISQGIAEGIASAAGVAVAAATDMAERVFSALRGFDLFGDLSGGIESLLRSFADVGAIAQDAIVPQVAAIRAAIAQAIGEFADFGGVSRATLDAIANLAGPARDAVVGLINAFFGLEAANDLVAQAQAAFDALTRAQQSAADAITSRLALVGDAIAEVLARQDLSQAGIDLSERILSDKIEELKAIRDSAIATLQEELGAANAQLQVVIDSHAADLSPLEQQLQAVQDARNALRRNERVEQLEATISGDGLTEQQRTIENYRRQVERFEQAARDATLSDEERAQNADHLAFARERLAQLEANTKEKELARLELEEIKLQEQIDLIRERQAAEREAADQQVAQIEEKISRTEEYYRGQIEYWQAETDRLREHEARLQEQYQNELSVLRGEEEYLQRELDALRARQAAELAHARAQVEQAQAQADAAADILATQEAIAREYENQNALLAEQVRIAQQLASERGEEGQPIVDISPLQDLFRQMLDALKGSGTQVPATGAGQPQSVIIDFVQNFYGNTEPTAVRAAGHDGMVQALREVGIAA